MAKHTQVILVDDIDGETADETVIFGLDGVDYEIDLSAGNAALLRDALAAYVDKARRVTRKRGSKSTAGRRPAGASAPGSTAAIRAWAVENNVAVSKRGRISADVIALYEAAHSK